MLSRRRFITRTAAAVGGVGFAGLRALANTLDPPEPDGSLLEKFRTPDGRVLEFLTVGAEDGLPLVCHHGTPSTAITYAQWGEAARAENLRVVAFSRPGYGRSTRLPGRNVAQAAGDTAALLDHLGLDAFLTLGWSGGGPHALACAAGLSGRCKGAATLAGVGPWGRDDLDFLAGMGQENVDEFSAALQGAEAVQAFLAENYAAMGTVTGADVAASLGGLISTPDKAVLTDAFAENLAASFRWAVHSGYGGWVDDDLAFTKNWGFSLADIQVPVTVWQGEQDLMVPGAHGRWLQQHIPGSELRFEPDQGHLSLVTAHLPTILRDLRAGR